MFGVMPYISDKKKEDKNWLAVVLDKDATHYLQNHNYKRESRRKKQFMEEYTTQKNYAERTYLMVDSLIKKVLERIVERKR